jgi:lysophospholipase L1-like esterase
MNLDRILPPLAPAVRHLLARKQAQREAQFAAAPPAPGRVVFLGDSITEWTAWEDWFPNLKTTNRGIGGQAIRDVMARLDTAIIAPRAVSLLIGTNDLHGMGASKRVEAIAAQMDDLVGAIRDRAPDAVLLINSVLPRSALFRDRIGALNEHNRAIAAKHVAGYIDLWPALAGADGAMRPEFSPDGIHLSIAGYRAWTEVLRPYLSPLGG